MYAFLAFLGLPSSVASRSGTVEASCKTLDWSMIPQWRANSLSWRSDAPACPACWQLSGCIYLPWGRSSPISKLCHGGSDYIRPTCEANLRKIRNFHEVSRVWNNNLHACFIWMRNQIISMEKKRVTPFTSILLKWFFRAAGINPSIYKVGPYQLQMGLYTL